MTILFWVFCALSCPRAQDAVNWDVGMQVVVTGTALKDARDWHQNEVRTIAATAAASHLGQGITQVALSAPLDFHHYGGAEYQAEVGLLKRQRVPSISGRGIVRMAANDWTHYGALDSNATLIAWGELGMTSTLAS